MLLKIPMTLIGKDSKEATNASNPLVQLDSNVISLGEDGVAAVNPISF